MAAECSNDHSGRSAADTTARTFERLCAIYGRFLSVLFELQCFAERPEGKVIFMRYT
jgi:hypothetical protein